MNETINLVTSADSIQDKTIYNPIGYIPNFTLYQAIRLYGNLIEEVYCFVGKGENPHSKLGYRTWHETSDAFLEWEAYIEEYNEGH